MLDSLSGGRAEIMAGRGAFTETFGLFGYELDDYDELFAEKLELLLALRTGRPVTWSGKHRAPLFNVTVHPAPVQQPIPVWLGVGGSRNSFVRAGRLGLPLALGIVGGPPAHFAPSIDLYRRVLEAAGHPQQPVAITQHGFVASTTQAAADIYYPADAEVMNRIGRERGFGPTSRAEFEAKIRPDGAYLVGSPSQVVEKILHQHEIFGHQRTLFQLAIGSVGHADLMRAIELLGTEVAPAVRSAIGSGISTPTPVGAVRAIMPTRAAESPIAAITTQPRSKATSEAWGVAGAPTTATNTETPTASPTWRSMLTTAEPVAKDCGGSDAAPVAMKVGSVSPTPAPVKSVPGSTCPR
jgi:hypothetical protein